MRRWSRGGLGVGTAAAAAALLTACSTAPGVLTPAGAGADSIARLFWIMAAGAAVVWLAVVGLALYAGVLRPRPHDRRSARWLIVGGGVITPTLVLGALLVYGLVLMPQLREPAAHDGLRIAVSGEQWWWRVHYYPAGAAPGMAAAAVTDNRRASARTARTAPIALANEIRLPVGERVQFTLTSPDVIHSFWIPALGGKVDMIPGRTNTLVLQPTRTGVFRGACAEYCGTSHALMQLVVVVMEPGAFARWLRHQAAPATPPRSELARRGRDAFLANGCGACHAIRGTPADGRVGPDLTHVGSRLSLAAGILPNDRDAFRRWIGHTQAVKPEALMPAFGMLPGAELQAISVYLEGLQ